MKLRNPMPLSARSLPTWACPYVRFGLLMCRLVSKTICATCFPQKVRHALDRDLLRDSIKILFDTGLFADIKRRSREDRQTGDTHLRYRGTLLRWFGHGGRRSGSSQREPVGQRDQASTWRNLRPRETERANKNIQQVMSDNGFYRSAVTHDEHPHPETSQMDVVFRVTPGSPASGRRNYGDRDGAPTPRARSKTSRTCIPAIV